MVNAHLKDLKKLLSGRGLNVEMQPETDQLYILFEIMGKHFPLFIKVVDAKLVQLLIFIPLALKEEHLLETGRLLHYLNRQVDLPGFCLDEQNKVIFYRLVLPAADAKVDDDTVVTMVRACQVACESAIASIVAVSQGSMPFKQFVASAEEAKSKLSKGATSQ